MIVYEMRKPSDFSGGNCVGVTGENLAFTQEFLIKGMRDIGVSYYIHLRFADGIVNSVIPDSTQIDESGTRLVWKVKKNDIFMHGYFELQLEGRSDDGFVFQTEIVTMYADESIPIEDKEYLNPNSETIKLREELYAVLDETKHQHNKIDENKKLIEKSDLSKKENISNKIVDKRSIDSPSQNYPSIQYLDDYYTPAELLYECDEIDEMLTSKADKATTLDGYGITDAIKNSPNAVESANIADGAVTAEKLGEDVTAAINGKAGQSKVSQIDSRLQNIELNIKNKVNNSTFSAAIAQKYDSSNVETGSGNLTPAQEAYEGCEGSFNYSKVGSTVTVSLKINALLTGKNYVQFAGLPYRAITASKLSSMAAYTTNNKLVNLRIDGSWLYIFYPVGTFADGEKINATITYITN